MYSQKEEESARSHYLFLIDALGSVAKEHINPILAWSLASPKVMIVTEYWQATTLETLIESESGPEAREIGFMFAQLATALRFLNEHKIIHRDIRLAGFSESCSGLADKTLEEMRNIGRRR